MHLLAFIEQVLRINENAKKILGFFKQVLFFKYVLYAFLLIESIWEFIPNTYGNFSHCSVVIM